MALQTKCWICKEKFVKEKDKVKDHCYFTGKYRGAAHKSCSRKYKKPNFTPVVFHNLTGYDSHLFIKNLAFSEGDIDCIPNNEEKYISFTKNIKVACYMKEVKDKNGETTHFETRTRYHNIRLIDSFKFMATSLEKLANNLQKDDFINVKRYYKDDKLELVTRKGVYPYEYMDMPEKLKETKLPAKEAFYTRLNDEGITNENYAHAQKVWETFEMKTLEDYHELYNQVDVLLLADIFENFRSVCIKNYNLDPAHYYTAPGLAWDAALKVADIKLRAVGGYRYVVNG